MGNQIVRHVAVPSEHPLANVLRSILAWMDSRNVVEVVEDEPEPEAPATLPAPVEPDDGLMKPDEVIAAAAALLWARRGEVTITTTTDESKPDMQMHSDHHPITTVLLPGGVEITFPEGYHEGYVKAPDGQKQAFHASSAALMEAWHSIQTAAFVDLLGLEDLLDRDPEDDGSAPVATHRTMLAEAIGRYLEARAPRECTETYVHEYTVEIDIGERRDSSMSRYSYSSSSRRATRTEIQHADRPSIWLDIGEGVLMRLDRHQQSTFRGGDYGTGWIADGKTKPHAILKHASLGAIRIPIDPVAKALEKRRRMSLTEALGEVRPLPRHLPMPRGNAQAARVLRLCREAIAIEPDLVDASGTPIAPLVDQHLPELMKRHQAASAIAPESELAAIDAELMEGIERVRRTVDEALACSAVKRRDDMRTQLRFLEMRHPDQDGALMLPAAANDAPATGKAA